MSGKDRQSVRMLAGQIREVGARVARMSAPARRRIKAVLLRGTAAFSGLLLLGAGGLWSRPALFHAVAIRMGAAAAGASRQTILVEGDDWPYLDAGRRGAPVVLMLHGFGSSKNAMLLPLNWLRETHRVIVPDLPGFGEHPLHGVAVPDADWYLERIDSLADALGLKQFSLVGTSMGGALAAAYAAAHPERVDRLVLLAPAGVQAPVKNSFMAAVESGRNPLEISSESDFNQVVELVFARPPAVPGPFRRHIVQLMIERLEATDRIVEALRPFLLDGLTPLLPGIQAPTMVIYGEEDRVTDPSMAERFRAELPGAQVEIVPDAGHVVFADSPRRVRQLMAEFLAPVALPDN